ncbi:methyltransferase-like protein 25B isoform X2 [Bacillus rossius redtenbacheri]|uniref:methyltransferase-like protein 25B isoform X2 n=1 Tax=Bacillus rossius redtenbacheri TaxID=93214 RepID=UPI002FDDBFF6
MLPANCNYESYFKESLCYLRDYQWIYNFAVTNVLVEDVLSRIPEDWLSALMQLTNDELNQLPFGFEKDGWPASLAAFCRRSRALLLAPEHGPPGVDPAQLPRELRTGLSPKKQHEVCRLAALVQRECRALGATCVLDVGSGLGYLGRLLHHRYGLRVLGVEADPCKVATARRRALGCCAAGVAYVSAAVAPGCEPLVRRSVRAALLARHTDCCRADQEEEESPAVCAVALHACGDLTPSMLDLFAFVPELRGLVLVPCCHHKASPGGSARFPLSARLRAAARGAEIARPALLLRLASQETAARWRGTSEQEHGAHAFHVLSRAVLELHARQASLELVKKKRRCVRRGKLGTPGFEGFVSDALERYDHVGPGGDDEAELRAGLGRLWRAHEGSARALELLTALQVVMQAPAEHLVALDRLAYLREVTPGAEARLLRALDDGVSPRCLALVARKPPRS